MKLILFLILAFGSQYSTATIVFLEDFEAYTGAGLSPGGASGTLDSRQWRLEGLSGGHTQFGDRVERGSAARGLSTGRVRSGGLYAFTIAASRSLGWQSTGAVLTPGILFLQIMNTGQSVWRNLGLNYDLWSLNDQPRSSRITLQAATSTQSTQTLLGVETPTTATPNPAWQRHFLHASLLDLQVLPGTALTLQWRLADSGGQGSRDELAIDNLRLARFDPVIKVGDPMPSIVYLSIALMLLVVSGIRRKLKFNNA